MYNDICPPRGGGGYHVYPSPNLQSSVVPPNLRISHAPCSPHPTSPRPQDHIPTPPSRPNRPRHLEHRQERRNAGLEGVQSRSQDSRCPCSAAFSTAIISGRPDWAAGDHLALDEEDTEGGQGSSCLGSCGLLRSSSLMSMRSISTAEAGCSISNAMLQQQQEVLLCHLIAMLLVLGLRQNQRRHRATAPRSARSPAVQAPARSASSALATVSAMTSRPTGARVDPISDTAQGDEYDTSVQRCSR